jgi:hypothetical protein
MSEPEYVYRVVQDDGTPIRTGTYASAGGRQHTYPKQHTAEIVAKAKGCKVQRSRVEWEDV